MIPVISANAGNVATTTAQSAQRWVAGLHTALIAVLVALRPLVWDGDPLALDLLAYQTLTVLGPLLLAFEALVGWRRAWRFTWGGVAAAALVLALTPALWYAPALLPAWEQWWSLTLNLLFALYLMQVIVGRERVVIAALLAGCAAETLVALLQREWVLPALAKAQHSGALTLNAAMNSDLEERIRNGGLFGTFTLANTLAAYLVLMLPVAVGMFCAGRPRASALPEVSAEPLGRTKLTRGQGVCLALIGVGAALAFIGANSKAAMLALLVLSGVWWLVEIRGRWRWLPVAGAVLAALALLSPSVRGVFAASAQVRLGYWQGAQMLIGEHPFTGHGLGGFSAWYPHVMPLWAEPVRLAHNDYLELAVDAGVPLAVALVAVMAWLGWRRRPAFAPELRSDSFVVPAVVAPLAVFLAVTYLAVFGLLDGNAAWWPGGEQLGLRLAWVAAVGALMAGLMYVLRALPTPPGWAIALGLGALALHAAVDFDLHSAAVVGTAVTLACLAPLAVRTVKNGRFARIAVLLLALGAVGVQVWTMTAAADRRGARELRELLAVLRAGPRDQAERAAARLDELVPSETPRTVQTLVDAVITHARELAGKDLELRTALLPFVVSGAAREIETNFLRQTRPFSAFVASAHADDLAAMGRWTDAIDAARDAVTREPTALEARRRLIALLRRAADRDVDHADAWRAAAASEQAWLDMNTANVNPRMR